MRLRSVLTLALLMPLLTACIDHHAWNQKITVVVETPSGERSGSSVMHVEWNGGIPFIVGDARGGGYKLRGEAPVVDLGGGRYLFALLQDMEGLAHEVIAGGRGGMAKAGRAIKRAKQPYVLPESRYPLLVTFGDIADPMSVREVKPEDLAAHFGTGVKLKSITLEISDEPMTRGRVERVLEWLKDVWPSQLDGRTTETIRAENRIANSLGTGAFSTEVGR